MTSNDSVSLRGTSGIQRPPWGYTAMAGGHVTGNGTGTLIGNVYAAQGVACQGGINWGTSSMDCNVYAMQKFSVKGAATLHGQVTANEIQVTGTDNIEKKILSANVPLMEVPDLELDELYKIAQENGQVRDGGITASSKDYGAIPGGVLWIEGDATFNGAVNFEGCIIATGRLTFNGTVTHQRVGDFPSMVSRDASIKVNGHHTISGLMWANGDVALNGSGVVAGTIMARHDIRLNGAYGIVAYANSKPGTGDEDTREKVVITAWQK